MKKTITSGIVLLTSVIQLNAQSVVADFENLSLPTNTFYLNTSGNDWQTANAEFRYDYQSSFWTGGYAYTNKKDSSTAGFTNLYGCKAFNGYNNSNYYVTAQPDAFIKLKSPNNGVSGFYVTNSTYAYKSMKNGDSFAKKFGGATGNDPDFFLLTVRGYINGVMKQDSVNFYLADFRNSNNSLDYIVDNWQWVNTSSLNQVDSIKFILRSSDNGQFGMNTPAFFCLDNFTTISNAIGVQEITKTDIAFQFYPNPATNAITITSESLAKIEVLDMSGRVLLSETMVNASQEIDIRNLVAGIYMIKLSNDKGQAIRRLVKH
jgi:hypothetical protein